MNKFRLLRLLFFDCDILLMRLVSSGCSVDIIDTESHVQHGELRLFNLTTQMTVEDERENDEFFRFSRKARNCWIIWYSYQHRKK